MGKGSLWLSLLVSTVMWFVGDWLGDFFWPDNWVNSFLFSAMFAILGGGLVLAYLSMRRSNRRARTGRW